MQRVAGAFVISIILNGALLAVSISTDPRQEHLSTIESIADALLEPPAQLTMELVPGHSGTQVFMMFLFSLLMYTAMAWVALSPPRGWRRRT
jgi:hypothetical protein